MQRIFFFKYFFSHLFNPVLLPHRGRRACDNLVHGYLVVSWIFTMSSDDITISRDTVMSLVPSTSGSSSTFVVPRDCHEAINNNNSLNHNLMGYTIVYCQCIKNKKQLFIILFKSPYIHCNFTSLNSFVYFRVPFKSTLMHCNKIYFLLEKN